MPAAVGSWLSIRRWWMDLTPFLARFEAMNQVYQCSYNCTRPQTVRVYIYLCRTTYKNWAYWVNCIIFKNIYGIVIPSLFPWWLGSASWRSRQLIRNTECEGECKPVHKWQVKINNEDDAASLGWTYGRTRERRCDMSWIFVVLFSAMFGRYKQTFARRVYSFLCKLL
jgi:hypothetical protein